MKKVNTPLKYVLSFGKQYKIWLFVCIIFSLLDVAVSILIPIGAKNLIDMIPVSNSTEKFSLYVWFMVILLFMGVIDIFLRELSTYRFTEYTMRTLRNKISEHIQKLSFPYFKKHHSGDLVSRVNNDIDLIKNLLVGISDFIYQPLIFICAMIYGFLLSPKLLLITILVLGVAIGLNNIASKPISKFSNKLQEQFGKANYERFIQCGYPG